MDEQIASFWKRVNELIKAHGTKQEVVAQQCKVPYQTFKGWISRDRLPDAVQTCAIANTLHTTVEYLVTGENPKDHATEKLSDVISHAEEILRIAKG